LENHLGRGISLRYLFGMNDTEKLLLQTLLKLEENVAAMSTAQPKPNLLPMFSRIDELTRQLSLETDPQLRHYLQKKSYEKARLFLQGREAENARGNCHGHV
jgi:hypothetical protein